MRRAVLTIVVASCLNAGSAVLADEICLKGGGCLQGVILEQTSSSISIEIGPGRITFPMSRIERLTRGRSALSVYYERKRRLRRTDVRGWLELARWARDRGLATQARASYEHVTSLDPDNPEANQALGRILVGERWLTREDAYHIKGYTFFEGAWIPREERDAILEMRRIETDAAMAEAARAEATARRAEAEARARAAEEVRSESEAGATRGFWEWGLGSPCLIGHPCPPARVECAPYMSGPACRTEAVQTERRAAPKIRFTPRRPANPKPRPSPTTPTRRRSKTRSLARD